MTNCSNCGNPNLKTIPAGLSKKTGKPYSAFQKCEECGKTVNSNEPAPVRVIKHEETPNWDNIGMAKAATALYAACYQHGDGPVEAAEKVRAALNDIQNVQKGGFNEVPF